jgi:hypothetical protein
VSQAKVRSTAQRRGMTANPRWSVGLRTMCRVVRSRVCAQSRSRPANPPSAPGHVVIASDERAALSPGVVDAEPFDVVSVVEVEQDVRR